MLSNTKSAAMLPNHLFSTQSQTSPHVIAVGGGKGGVGKSSLSLMMALYLAQRGHETILIDADLTGANLHGYLGVWNTEKTIHTFLKGGVARLQDLILTTPFKGLSAIVGSLGLNSSELYRPYDTHRFSQSLKDLPAEYVILDLGAEGSALEIDLFLAARTGVMVSSNDLFSLQNVFNFVRSALLRRIRQQISNQEELQEKLMAYIQETDNGVAKPLLTAFKEWGYDIEKLRQWTNGFRPKIVLNMSSETDSKEALQGLRLSVSRVLSGQIDYWGCVPSEPMIRHAVKEFNPQWLCLAENKAFASIRKMMDRHMLASESMQKSAGPVFRGTLCSMRCLAWSCCNAKNGGLPCRINPIEILKRETCYA